MVDGYLKLGYIEPLKAYSGYYNEEKKLFYAFFRSGNKNIYVGSGINNNFTCREEVCEFYGGGGKDIYKRLKTSWDNKNRYIIIKDFNLYNNDTIYISSKKVNIIGNKNNTKIIDGKNVFILEGVKESDVKDWIDILNGILPESYKDEYTILDLPKLKKSNPIQRE